VDFEAIFAWAEDDKERHYDGRIGAIVASTGFVSQLRELMIETEEGEADNDIDAPRPYIK